ncbi:MAG: EAL domain-containing protein, partial [Methyloglobulus sp.]|nr:EAL domain-containing protein [Methyloglobulus sp.]
AIVAAIIAMAAGMDMAVIAEGVETQGQLDFVRGKRCHEVQGYFLCRPQPAAQIGEFLGLKPRD